MNGSALQKAALDEVCIDNAVSSYLPLTVSQNVQYFALALFWWFSKPVPGECKLTVYVSGTC